jgi:hypothetical protein
VSAHLPLPFFAITQSSRSPTSPFVGWLASQFSKLPELWFFVAEPLDLQFAMLKLNEMSKDMLETIFILSSVLMLS